MIKSKTQYLLYPRDVRAKRSLVAFIKYLNAESEIELEGINITTFKHYRINIYNPDAHQSHDTNNKHVMKRNPKIKTNKNDLILFKRHIKRDKYQYNILREDKQWDNWNRSTRVTAQSHDCQEVFIETCIPWNRDEKELFLEKQNYIYSVFEDKIQTNMGKYLVRKFEGTFDAQNIYAELEEYTKESTQASIESANILGYITTVKLHKIAWKDTYHSLILHWVNKMQLYIEMVPLADHLTNPVKKAMLEITVIGVPALKHVKNQSDHDRVYGKDPLSYDNYLTLLITAAATFDSEVGFKSRSKYTPCTIKYLSNNMEIELSGGDEEIHGIDTNFLEEEAKCKRYSKHFAGYHLRDQECQGYH